MKKTCILYCCLLCSFLLQAQKAPEKIPILYNILASQNRIDVDSIIYESTRFESHKIKIDSSDIYKIRFQQNSFNSLEYQLNYDTIISDLIFSDTSALKATNKYLKIDIEDCFINSNIYIDPVSQQQTVIFNNCVFSKEIRRIQIKADSVRFINCDFLDGNVTLEVLPSNKKVFFELYRTDVTNIRFTYPEKMELLFIRDTTYEIRKTVYEKLLSKFSTEGKDISYKNLDIEFRWWKAKNQSLVSCVGAFANQVWWNFGYSKNRVLFWTLLFLLIFSTFNLSKWEYISKTYPIEAISANITNELIAKRRGRVFILVLLYTSFIFFSLSLDFKNLKIVKLRYTVTFFIEYLIGIACLIFITNAILKF